MKVGQLKNMNIELNQDELNILIESLSEQKNEILCHLFNDQILKIDDLDHLKDTLDSIYTLKTKLFNYSILYQEEN